MRKLFLMFAAWGILFSGALHAQMQWNKVAGMPDGGNIMDIVSDNAGTIYALTSLHSNIFYTTDNGLHWTLMPNTSDLWNANSIEVDKATGTLFVGSLWFGVQWTSDKGQHWDQEVFHAVPGGFFADITQIGCKAGTGVVVAAESTGDSANIFISSNNGASWSVVPAVPWGATVDLKFIADGTLLAGVNNGVFRSPDNGVTWAASNTGIAGKIAYSLAQKKSNGHLFAAIGFDLGLTDTIYCGVYRSTDNGFTWTQVSTGIADHNVRCVEVDSANNKLYALTPDNVYESADEGATWTTVNTGIAGTNLNCIVKGHTGLYIGTSRMGVAYATAPATEGWTPRNPGMKVYTMSNLAMNYNNSDIHCIDLQNTGVYDLSGGTWSHQYNGLPLVQFWGLEIINDHNDVLYAVYGQRNDGIYRSTDHGATWTNIAAGIPGLATFSSMIYSARVDNHNNLYLIANNLSGGTSVVFRTTDLGSTWSTFLPPIPIGGSQYLDLDFGHSDIYLTSLGTDTMGTTSVSLSVSHDDGATFSHVAFNLGDLYGCNLSVAPNDSLYLQISDHIYKRNGINNWFQLPDAAWNHDYGNYPLGLYIDKDNHLFASSTKTGVFYCDNDSTWSDVTIGLPHFSYPSEPAPVVLTPTDIKFDKDNTPYGICTHRYGGDLQGIYKFSMPPTGFHDQNRNAGELKVYPNPCAAAITVNINVPGAGSTLLQVYNINGQVVRTETITGRQVSLNTESLVPGMYYIRATTNNKTLQASFIKE